MKLGMFNSFAPGFKGKREDRNTTNQLKNDNDYALTSNNQTKITNAIKNLGNESGESNVKFLLDVAGNLKYGTNIQNGKEPNNDWKTELKQATESSIAISDPIVKEKYTPEIDKVFNEPKSLSEDETDILKSQDYILSQVDKKQLDEQKNPNIKNFERNMSYFVVSSEIPIKQKKYVMGRLAHFMSPDYKINPQLEGKKTQAVAEMMNDLVVTTKESKVPNTKAINQKHHGMCAAISIARKLMSYEDKPNYVDNIMSELDDSPNLMVYDKTQIGKNVKVPVQKAVVDFDDADKKGYRIVDASTTQWMNVSDMFDADSTPKSNYIPFDRDNFGAFNDAHFTLTMDDPKLATKHRYYQALIKSKDVIGEAKKSKVEHEVKTSEIRNNYGKEFTYMQKMTNIITSKVRETVPSLSDKEAHDTTTRLLALRQETAKQIEDKVKDGTGKYHFIPNEESSMKDKKVKAFISSQFGDAVDTDKLDKNAGEIRDLVETVHSIQKEIHPESKISGKVADERKLFEAAVAYRTQMKFALQDPEYLTDRMIETDVPDSETLLSQNMAKVAAHIEKTGDPIYVNHFAPVLGVEPDKDKVVAALTELKGGVDSYLSDGMDSVYRGLGLGNRKQSLAFQVSEAKEQIQSGDKEELRIASMALKMKPDKNKVLKEYNKYEETLFNNPTDKQYTEIYNNLGNKDQTHTFVDSFNLVNKAFVDPKDEMSKVIIGAFNASNGIEGNEPTQKSMETLQGVASDFNQISQSIQYIKEFMTVTDKDGNVLNSAMPEDAVMKKMENAGTVIPAKELTPLRDRFDKLDQLRSQDEFSSRQGKISDPILYKFTNGEKETLKKIDKSVNKMYSETSEELAFVRAEIKKPLEEHMRKTGVDEGRYWMSEAHSGLSTPQEVKIIQQMSDRPYHATEDKEKAFDVIKNTSHSGISTTSVFHDKTGMHAQYIAEISSAGNENKDVLYHDNSWGASELENTWVGSDGLNHTDYSDKRGGETGYITNDKWRNGNYTEDLMTKTGEFKAEPIENRRLKKLDNDREEFKFALMPDVIVTGDDGQVKRIAASIKDNIFIPDTVLVPDITKQANEMTQSEIKSSIIRHKTAAKSYNAKIEKLDQRIETTPFNKGIVSQADYDSLGNDDPLKVTFEKAAFIRSFPDGANWKDVAQAKTVDAVHAFEPQREKNAKMYFNYAFAKDSNVLLAYALDKKTNKTIEIVDNALKNNNIELDDKSKIDIIRATASYSKAEKAQFDGSLKHTIGFMVGKTLNNFDRIVPKSENAELARGEIKDNLTKSLSDALYFNESDMDNTSTKFKAITKYIDKKYDPDTNEDFVNKYRNLQDMTTEEFNKETSDATNEDLAIKGYTGYDMLKSYKSTDNKTTTTVRNVLFQQELLGDIKLSDTQPAYKYHKLFMNHQADTYKNATDKSSGRTFDDLYRSFSSSLQTLDYEKAFNKHKDEAFRKYGSTPAYPKTSPLSDAVLKHQTDTLDSIFYQYSDQVKAKKGTLAAYSMVDTIGSMINQIPDDKKVSTKQAQSINNVAGAFITASYNDPSIQNSVKSAVTVVGLKPGATGADYKKAYAGMNKEFSAIKKMNPPEFMQDSIKNDAATLKHSLNAFIVMDIPERHHNILNKDLNGWLNSEFKHEDSENQTTFHVDKISQKIDKYSVGKKNSEYTKTVYLNELSSNMNHLYHTKLASSSNELQKNQASESFKSSFSTVLFTQVPDKNKETFTKSIIGLTNSDKKLSGDDVNDALVKAFSKFSTTNKEDLLKDEVVAGLSNSIQVINKCENTSKAYSKHMDSTLKAINDSTYNFVSSNIKPEYQKSIAASVDDIVDETLSDKKGKFDPANAMIAHDKFMDDFKKYHFLNYPEDILNSYLLLSAKDSPVNSKDKKEAGLAKMDLEVKTSGLTSSLENAALVDMQDSLMDAVDSGNESAVANKFSNYDTTLKDPKTGGPLNMADDAAVDYMARMLILGDDNDTAAMFINKLGLATKFLRAENKILNVDKTKKDVNSIVNLLGTTSTQLGVLRGLTQGLKAPEFDDDVNYAQTIDDTKTKIIEKTNKMPRQESIKTYLGALDEVKTTIISNPEVIRSSIVSQILGDADKRIVDSTNTNITKIQDGINSVTNIYKLVDKVKVHEGSEADTIKKEYMQKQEILNKHINAALGKIPKDGSTVVQIQGEDV